MRKTFFFILSLMLSINIYKCEASHQVIEITFNDGTVARYTKGRLESSGQVIKFSTLQTDKISIDSALPMDQIQLQLSQSPFICQAILKTQTPDEIFERELEDYCLTKLDKKGMPLRDKIMLNRELIKLIGEHAVLGSQ